MARTAVVLRAGALGLPMLLAACSGGAAPAAAVDDVPTYAVHAEVRLQTDEDGESVTFLTPALSTFTMPAADVAGKAYYVAVFDGGFEQGVDFDRHHEWGVVPDDLVIRYTSPSTLPSGPYDVSVIVYTQQSISEETMADFYAVVPRSGELSAFSLSQERVKAGDPRFSNGVVRVNLEDDDGSVLLENHHDTKDLLGSMTDTVLTVP